MTVLRLAVLLSTFVCISVDTCSAQAQPSEPISESKIKAGNSFPITIPLARTSPQVLNVTVSYYQTTGNRSGRLECSGSVSPGQHDAFLSCVTTRGTPPGEYRAVENSLMFSRSETGDHLNVPGERFPIITIVAPDPYDATIFPEVSGTAKLSLDLRSSFFDAASRSEDILSDLANHFSTTTKDTAANRAYLRGQVQLAKGVIDLTRTRTIVAPHQIFYPGSQNLAPIFQDFDRRLDAILQELPAGRAYLPSNQEPVLTLASMQQHRPQTSDSITVTPSKDKGTDTLQKAFGDFVDTLTDMAKGFLGISKDGSPNFQWSIATTPPGAEVWYSRLGEPEIKWAGVSDLKDQTLVKARWIFRVSWSGCSKKVDLDPWLQNPIPLQEVKAGCKDDVSH